MAEPVATADVADAVCAIALRRHAGRGWWIAFAGAGALSLLFVVATVHLLATGVGIWGLDKPVMWAFAIADYVWWIGIGMAGTFISGALLLMRQDWRTAINRYAETMTVFAVAVSGFFPILHLGRPWFFYWLAPYPDTMNLWPQWRSSLFWDFSAIIAYLAFSLMLWYVGMLPDLALLRDRATTHRRRVFYGLLALGWRGEARHWDRQRRLMRLMAALAVPLVFSVHSMVALDFSEAITPGWHTTLFPPFFVAGALFSGFAMVIVLALLLRRVYGLGAWITLRHLDLLARLLLTVGLVVAYSYAWELFTAFYSGGAAEIETALSRMTGRYAPVYWATIACNALAPQLLWSRAVRRSAPALLAIALLVIVGMWLERYMLIVTSLYHGHLPAQWGGYWPTFWDWAHLWGSVGLFALMGLLFARWLPLLAVYDVREQAHVRNRVEQQA